MGNIGERLRREREALDIKPEPFAIACGAKKSSQYRYESGERSPDGEYFALAAKLGIDVLYVLTGQRQQLLIGEPRPPAYTPAEHLAVFIATLKLSEVDAEMLKELAKRLAIM
jgi:transcriptional regulator with XRE-family HTH domain